MGLRVKERPATWPKIEKNIPIPPRFHSGSSRGRSFPELTRYPFHLMEIGDSFLSTADFGESTFHHRKRVRSSATSAEKRYGKLYTVRRLKNENGIRVWRTA